MFLIIRQSDNVILASSSSNVNEEDCETRDEYVIELPDNEFSHDMIGAIYNGPES